MNIFYRIDNDLQYYPTPEKLLEDIIDNIEFSKKDILFLEPSAGDGAICRYIKDNSRNNINIHCIEKDSILSNSLTGQGFNVVHDDFDTFQTQPIYDLIIMNPPFSKCVKHVLKAYDFINGGGQVIAIINAESIKNDFSKDRKLLKNLIEKVGNYKFMEGAFLNADRKTDVEIAIIHLIKPIYENEFDFWGKLKDEVKTNEELIADKFKDKVESSALMSFDVINGSISMYRTIIEKLFKIIDTVEEFKNIFKYIEKECDFFKLDTKNILSNFIENNSVESKVFITKTIRQIIWSYIFDKTDCKEYIYSKEESDFYNQLKDGSINIPFTRDNILTFLEDIFLKRGELFEKGIESLFEEITSYYNGNEIHREGWKTNKNWKINKKIIVKWGIFSFEEYFDKNSGKYSMYHKYERDWISDLDRLVRQIDKRLNNCYAKYGNIKESLREKFYNLDRVYKNQSYDNTCETPYFYLKFWKKGTLHIIFKDDKILEELNVIGANLRKELGYEIK